jgi:ubiquitin C-terminal hydrolase
MSLNKAGEEYLPIANGFINNGSSCWFNAVMSGLLSCPIFNKTMLDNSEEKDYKENLIAIEYINLLKQILPQYSKSISDSPDTPSSGKVLSNAKMWALILKSASKRNDNIQFSYGQNCAGEGIDMFLDTLEDLPDIIKLFTFRTIWKSWCYNCQKWSEPKLESDYTYKIPCSFINEQSAIFKNIDPFYQKAVSMDSFITINTGYIDKDHQCNNCNKRCEKFKVTKLDFLPEILIVMAKRYKYNNAGQCEKINDFVDFPSEMTFEGLNNEIIQYKAVAQIEHSGTYNSGHYWAICNRSGGWFNINDQSVVSSEFKPSSNTYIVFYHIL